MTLATFEAVGAEPAGQGRYLRLRTFVNTHAHEIVAGVQAAAVAGLALGIAGAPRAHSKAPVVEAAVTSPVHTSITPEALAGPAPAIAKAVDSKHILQALLTEAGLRPNFALSHLSLEQARRLNALMPGARATDAARPFVIPLDTKNGKEALQCLTEAAYFEAGANGQDAQAAVVQVVLNRVRHPDFPKTVCGVVYQGSQKASGSGGCQFTFTCDGALRRGKDAAAWNAAAQVARRALQGYVVRSVGASTYYHADYVFPAWAPGLLKTATVGPHIFYRMRGEEGASSYLTGQYVGGEARLQAAIRHALAAGTPEKGEGVEIAGIKGVKVHAQYAAAPMAEVRPAAAEVVKAAAPSVETPPAAADSPPAA